MPINHYKLLILASAVTLGFVATPTQASLTFNFNYLTPGIGFNDPTTGAERKNALNNAANLLGSYFSAYTANLTFDVNSTNTANGSLASAGSPMFLKPGTFQETAVQTKILSNGTSDITGTGADGSINWNFSYNWGLGNNISSSQYDFTTVALHELLHSFGFSSNIGSGGTGLQGNVPGIADTFSTFDQFLTTNTGASLFSTPGVFDSTKVNALTGGNSVRFSGANANAANGSKSVDIYSPTTFQSGSSISHLNDTSFSNPNLIMEHAVNSGPGTRTLSSIEIGILKDIGYSKIATPAAVPAPAAVWLMLSGVFGLLALGRNKASL